MNRLTKKIVNDLSYQIIGAAIEVHKTLGPGLYEDVYEACVAWELEKLGLAVEYQKQVLVDYKGVQIDTLLRYDLLVEKAVVVELKSVREMHPIFEAQILTYMRLLKVPKGVLINFFCTNIFKEGQKTFVNDLYAALPDE